MTVFRNALQPGLPAVAFAPEAEGPPFLQSQVLDRHLARMSAVQQADLIAQLKLDLTKASADLARAKADDDPAGLRRALHNLVALAGTVGCDDLAMAAADLQQLTRSAPDTGMAADIGPLQRLTATLIAAIDSHASAAVRTAT